MRKIGLDGKPRIEFVDEPRPAENLKYRFLFGDIRVCVRLNSGQTEKSSLLSRGAK
jgi:hypothetical protein